MRNCTMNYRSSLFTSTITSFHVCKVQDPKPWWNCPYTEGAAAVNTFIHCQVYVTRTLALGREPELGHHLSPNRPRTARKKTLKLGFSPWNCVVVIFLLVFCHTYWSWNALPSHYSHPAVKPWASVSNCSLSLFKREMTATQHFKTSYGTKRKRNQALTSKLL